MGWPISQFRQVSMTEQFTVSCSFPHFAHLPASFFLTIMRGHFLRKCPTSWHLPHLCLGWPVLDVDAAAWLGVVSWRFLGLSRPTLALLSRFPLSAMILAGPLPVDLLIFRTMKKEYQQSDMGKWRKCTPCSSKIGKNDGNDWRYLIKRKIRYQWSCWQWIYTSALRIIWDESCKGSWMSSIQ